MLKFKLNKLITASVLALSIGGSQIFAAEPTVENYRIGSFALPTTTTLIPLPPQNIMGGKAGFSELQKRAHSGDGLAVAVLKFFSLAGGTNPAVVLQAINLYNQTLIANKSVQSGSQMSSEEADKIHSEQALLDANEYEVSPQIVPLIRGNLEKLAQSGDVDAQEAIKGENLKSISGSRQALEKFKSRKSLSAHSSPTKGSGVNGNVHKRNIDVPSPKLAGGNAQVSDKIYSQEELDKKQHEELNDLYLAARKKHGLNNENAHWTTDQLKAKILELQGSGHKVPYVQHTEDELDEKGKTDLTAIYLNLVDLTKTRSDPSYKSWKPHQIVDQIMALQKKLASSSGGGGLPKLESGKKPEKRNLQEEFKELVEKLNGKLSENEGNDVNKKLELLIFEMENLGIQVGETEDEAEARREGEKSAKIKAEEEKKAQKEKERIEKEKHNKELEKLYKSFDKSKTYETNTVSHFLALTDDKLIAYMTNSDNTSILMSAGADEKNQEILRIWKYHLDVLDYKIAISINSITERK